MDELCAGTVSPEMLTLKGVSKVFGQGGGYTGESSEGDAAWEGCLWVCLSVSPPLQINPSPGGDQCCLFGLLWWFPAAGRAGVLQVPPGLSGMCRALGALCPLAWLFPVCPGGVRHLQQCLCPGLDGKEHLSIPGIPLRVELNAASV